MNRAERFFSESEKERIETAIQAAEKKTTGEVAVMLVPESDEYREASLLGSILAGAGLSMLLAEFLFEAALHPFILLTIPSVLLALLLFRFVPSLRIAFVGRRRMETAVRERAVRAFYEKGLYRTRENTGVLFFLSLLEHKVWVLADRGIYEKIDQQTLNTFAATVSTGIREGRACEALCRAIEDAGTVLAAHFPQKPDDRNELPDRIMTG